MERYLEGKVISNKTKHTLMVEVSRVAQHSIYKKRIRRSKKYIVHYEGTNIKVGDTVKILPTRPISKNKHYKIMTERKEK